LLFIQVSAVHVHEEERCAAPQSPYTQTHITPSYVLQRPTPTSPVCSPHVSGPFDRLRPSLRPFARRCCVCQALASCGNFIGHRNAASAKPAHLQTRNPARQAVGEGCYPRVTCSTPSTGPDCISLLLHIPLRQATANTAHFYTWRALLMDPCVSRCATNQPRVPP